MKPRTFNAAFTRTAQSHYAQPPGGHARGAGMGADYHIAWAISNAQSNEVFPEFGADLGPASWPSIAAGQEHAHRNVTVTRICFRCVTNWLHLSDNSGGRDAPSARLPGGVTERNLYATVQRQPEAATLPRDPGPDWPPFTDTNVIFAGWAGGPIQAGRAGVTAGPAGGPGRREGGGGPEGLRT